RPVAAQEEVVREGRRGHAAFLRCAAGISSPAGMDGLIPDQMDPRDEDDLDFEFFDDEPATTEVQPQSRVRLPRRGGRGTGARRPAGPRRPLTPIVRLL